MSAAGEVPYYRNFSINQLKNELGIKKRWISSLEKQFLKTLQKNNELKEFANSDLKEGEEVKATLDMFDIRSKRYDPSATSAFDQQTVEQLKNELDIEIVWYDRLVKQIEELQKENEVLCKFASPEYLKQQKKKEFDEAENNFRNKYSNNEIFYAVLAAQEDK
jgi:hypothetical protein